MARCACPTHISSIAAPPSPPPPPPATPPPSTSGAHAQRLHTPKHSDSGMLNVSVFTTTDCLAMTTTTEEIQGTISLFIIAKLRLWGRRAKRQYSKRQFRFNDAVPILDLAHIDWSTATVVKRSQGGRSSGMYPIIQCVIIQLPDFAIRHQ